MTSLLPESLHILSNRYGEALYTTVSLPEDSERGSPLVLFLHGFKGFRNYSFLPWFAQYAASLGMISVRFCFSRNGMNGTSWAVQDAEAFAMNTISHEVDDVLDVVYALRHLPEFAELRTQWNGVLHIVGHSRGGGVAMVASRELRSMQPTLSGRIIALNSVGSWVRWTPRQRDRWAAEGSMGLQNTRTLQDLRMDMSYLEDIEQNAERLSLDQASRAIDSSLRFIHAEHDLTVPLTEITSLHQRNCSTAEIVIIPNTTHTFGMTHPVEHITHGFLLALRETFLWLIK